MRRPEVYSTALPAAGENVLLVYHFFPGYREKFLEAAARDGWSFAADVASKDDAMTSVDHKVFQGRFHPLRNRWLGPFLWQSGLLALLTRRRFSDVILLGNPFYLSNYVVLLLQRIRGGRVHYWTHGVRPKASRFRTFLAKFSLAGADTVFVYGDRSREQLSGVFVPRRRIHVVYNSLNSSLQAGVRRASELESAATPVRAVFVGRLVARKRLDLLVRAIGLLAQRGARPIELIVIGDGPCRSELEELAMQLGVGAVIQFRGEMRDEQALAKEFLACDLAIIPGAAGLSVIHAMWHGLPVITDDDFSRHGPEVEFVVEGVTGMHYRAGDALDLGDCIERLSGSIGDFCPTAIAAKVRSSFTPEAQIKVMSSRFRRS